MKIAMIADPHVPVPPVRYGGSERIIDLMCRGLVARGHQVHLMAGPGSTDYGGGLTVHRAPTLASSSRAFRKLWFQVLSWRAAAGADVLINHGRLDYLELLYRTRMPMIHWFHNPLTGLEVPYLRNRGRSRDILVGVSRSQVSVDPASGRFEVVHNAVEVDSIPFSAAPSAPPYVLFLGRMTRNKGVHLAIEAARRARIRLILGGNISREEGGPEYFETMVKPRLGPECEWVGEYHDAMKYHLLAGATALLFPIQWSEPFGLVMLEALASGVPVIATRMASTSEVVIAGENGFLCDTMDELTAAISRVREVPRHACRTSAEQRFSRDVLVSRVEALLGQACNPRNA